PGFPKWDRESLFTGVWTPYPPALAEVPSLTPGSPGNQLVLAWTDPDGHINTAQMGFIGKIGQGLETEQTFPPLVNGVLTIDGDQLGANYNDDVTIERSGSGGVTVTVNGAVAEYGPGVLTGIVVNTKGGTNTVTVAGDFGETGVPLTINGGGNDRLAFSGALPSGPVYTPDSGGHPDRRTLPVGNLVISFTGLEVVESVAPALPAAGLRLDAPVIDENGTVTLSGEFLDPGSLATHTVEVIWGDGLIESLPLVTGERTFTLTHQY